MCPRVQNLEIIVAVAQDDATYAGDADADADNMALNIEMGSLAVSDVAQHAAESALASLEVPHDSTLTYIQH